MNISNEDLLQISKRYGTPLYVYDADVIIQRYNELFELIPWPKLKIFYAMKANYNLAILKLLEKQGSNIDAVSVGDILLAKKAGFSSDRILFTANKITDEEMHKVKEENVLFNIGSLSRLEKYGESYPNSEVCIRFNPDVVSGEHEKVRTGGEATKFGILLRDLPQVKEIISKYNLKVIGIHEHTGSGISETVQMMAGMKNLLEIANPENFPDLRFIDFGGGFKVPFYPEEIMPNYKDFGRQVAELVRETSNKYGRQMEIYFEPGKYLVSEAGNLLIEVTTLKNTNTKLIAGTNSGFPQLIRPMFYQSYHHIENISNINAEKKKYDIVGNICETGDCFGTDRALPKIREGDILKIKNAGAYCYSMGGNYNLRPMPSEVMISNSQVKLVRKSQSNEEMINQIVNESLGNEI